VNNKLEITRNEEAVVQLEVPVLLFLKLLGGLRKPVNTLGQNCHSPGLELNPDSRIRSGTKFGEYNQDLGI
jgi:hypothetical protein